MSTSLVEFEHRPWNAITPRDDDDIEAQRRAQTMNILSELKSVVIKDADYEQYCSRMQALGFEPYERDQLWHFGIERIFGPDGLLARALPNYKPRSGQILLAHHVTDAIASGKILMAEAGTGIGKTFAYLVPPIVAGRRIMVSTGTKALQDQLTKTDIPNLVAMLDVPQYHHMALKGMSNYICRLKVESRQFIDTHKGSASTIRVYADQCAHCIDDDRYQATFGEINNLNIPDFLRSAAVCNVEECRKFPGCSYAQNRSKFLDRIKHTNSVHKQNTANSKVTVPVTAQDAAPEPVEPQTAPEPQKIQDLQYESDIWPKIDGSHCFNFAARFEAKQRQIVAINHALLAQALTSTDLNGFNKADSLLPMPDVLVIDEAHTFHEKCRDAFTKRISINALLQLPQELKKVLNSFISLKLLVPADVEDFTDDIPKYDLLVRTLMWGVSFYDQGKLNSKNFKYRHLLYPSSFDLLGPCLIHPHELELLGSDSCLRKVIKELEAHNSDPKSSSQNFFAALHIYRQSSFDFSNLDDDEAYFFFRQWHMNNMEQERVLRALHARYQQLITKLQESCHTPRSKMQTCLVPPCDKPMADVANDVNGQPPIETFFQALMRDLWLAISQVSKLLDNKLPSLDPQKQDHLELEVQLNGLKGQLNLSKEVISSFMNADRDKHGELQWDYAAWIEVSAPQEPSQQRARSGYNQRSGFNQRTGSNPWPTYELVIAPIDIGKLVAPKLQLLREKGTTIVFTSATITVNQQFTKICHDTGLTAEEVNTQILPSPFDYEQNSCLLTSSKFPEIEDPKRISKCIQLVKDAIECVDGGVFFLTTSYSKLNEAAQELNYLFGRARTILVQGKGTPAQLISRFKQDGRAILVGTNSFWEGVDVPGKALSLVIIDKLPFKTFAEPLPVALRDLCEFNGGSSFKDISIPEAIIMLRQGVGRLVRTESDTGALIVMDPRLQTKKYGASFFNSLPSMHCTTSFRELTEFLHKRKTFR